jgi:predicted phage replisome organizer
MAEKKYYWLKLPFDFFKDRTLKKLMKLSGGATYILIYQKLLLLSLENEGKIFFENVEESFIEEMSLELDETIEDMQIALGFLHKNNLIEQLDEYTYYMTRVAEMIGSETDAARRKRKSRAKNIVTLSQPNVTKSQLNVTKSQEVTKCHTEKEKEKEKDINKENNCINSDYKIQEEWFDTVWKLYPRKEGKHKILRSKAKLKELYEDKENVKSATINYAKKVKNTEKQFIKLGSTFYNGDYIDFIKQDENEYFKKKYGI